MLDYFAEVKDGQGPAQSSGLPMEHRRNKGRKGLGVSVRCRMDVSWDAPYVTSVLAGGAASGNCSTHEAKVMPLDLGHFWVSVFFKHRNSPGIL